ncbi:MAG: hypothetical protein PHT60_05005 [Acidiphilium sp.]|nr:hypothetical protein [Acidiphilium sp.]MDD4935122.1 hypothetical protein [Acidiphilium sp.]
MRNGRAYLLSGNPQGRMTHRNANECEAAKWGDALALHKTWGGAEEEFFGVPL